jgi:hypothetical protein
MLNMLIAALFFVSLGLVYLRAHSLLWQLEQARAQLVRVRRFRSDAWDARMTRIGVEGMLVGFGLLLFGYFG